MKKFAVAMLYQDPKNPIKCTLILNVIEKKNINEALGAAIIEAGEKNPDFQLMSHLIQEVPAPNTSKET